MHLGDFVVWNDKRCRWSFIVTKGKSRNLRETRWGGIDSEVSWEPEDRATASYFGSHDNKIMNPKQKRNYGEGFLPDCTLVFGVCSKHQLFLILIKRPKHAIYKKILAVICTLCFLLCRAITVESIWLWQYQQQSALSMLPHIQHISSSFNRSRIP